MHVRVFNQKDLKDIIIIINNNNNIKFLIVPDTGLGDAKRKQDWPDSCPLQRSQKQAFSVQEYTNSQISTKTYVVTETWDRKTSVVKWKECW